MCHLKAEKNKSFWMFTEPDTVLFAYVYVVSFYSIIPLCPYHVCSNLIMIIFSVDGHHLAILYDRTLLQCLLQSETKQH